MAEIKQKTLVKTIIALGMVNADKVEIRSEEGVEYRGKDINKAKDMVFELEIAGINFLKGGKCIGWVEVLPYEDTPDVPFNYSDNDFTNTLMSEDAIVKLMEA